MNRSFVSSVRRKTLIGLAVLCGLVSAQQRKAPDSARMKDGKKWTTQNLNLDMAPSWCYDDSETNCQRYGRLYTWDSARQACQSLGYGWRLPSEEDWRQLAKRYGGVSEDAKDRGKSAYQSLLIKGGSRFSAVLGGGRSQDGQYARLQGHGFYWTATENDPTAAWFYNFAHGQGALFRQEGGEKQRAFSVRCVRD
jgi:uncharacterized protein (TIGR02145 family)